MGRIPTFSSSRVSLPNPPLGAPNLGEGNVIPNAGRRVIRARRIRSERGRIRVEREQEKADRLRLVAAEKTETAQLNLQITEQNRVTSQVSRQTLRDSQGLPANEVIPYLNEQLGARRDQIHGLGLDPRALNSVLGTLNRQEDHLLTAGNAAVLRRISTELGAEFDNAEQDIVGMIKDGDSLPLIQIRMNDLLEAKEAAKGTRFTDATLKLNLRLAQAKFEQAWASHAQTVVGDLRGQIAEDPMSRVPLVKLQQFMQEMVDNDLAGIDQEHANRVVKLATNTHHFNKITWMIDNDSPKAAQEYLDHPDVVLPEPDENTLRDQIASAIKLNKTDGDAEAEAAYNNALAQVAYGPANERKEENGSYKGRKTIGMSEPGWLEGHIAKKALKVERLRHLLENNPKNLARALSVLDKTDMNYFTSGLFQMEVEGDLGLIPDELFAAMNAAGMIHPGFAASLNASRKQAGEEEAARLAELARLEAMHGRGMRLPEGPATQGMQQALFHAISQAPPENAQKETKTRGVDFEKTPAVQPQSHLGRLLQVQSAFPQNLNLDLANLVTTYMRSGDPQMLRQAAQTKLAIDGINAFIGGKMDAELNAREIAAIDALARADSAGKMSDEQITRITNPYLDPKVRASAASQKLYDNNIEAYREHWQANWTKMRALPFSKDNALGFLDERYKSYIFANMDPNKAGEATWADYKKNFSVMDVGKRYIYQSPPTITDPEMSDKQRRWELATEITRLIVDKPEGMLLEIPGLELMHVGPTATISLAAGTRAGIPTDEAFAALKREDQIQATDRFIQENFVFVNTGAINRATGRPWWHMYVQEILPDGRVVHHAVQINYSIEGKPIRLENYRVDMSYPRSNQFKTDTARTDILDKNARARLLRFPERAKAQDARLRGFVSDYKYSKRKSAGLF